MIEFEAESLQEIKMSASIKVIGIGGAGGNTVSCIVDSGCKNIDFVIVNTDIQPLNLSKVEKKIQIGVKATKGLGTGTDAELGKRAAEEDLDKVMEVLEGADIVFITAGMGGGTGSGVAPVIARALKEKGILSIAVVTKPFLFEGKRRAQVAEQAIKLLAQEVDTLIVIPNQKLLEITGQEVSMMEGFSMINEILMQSVRAISDIIVKPGHVNVDFADVRTIMKDRGLAVMGTGIASGQDRAEKAAIQATTSPLLENQSIAGAHSVLINITGDKNLRIHEISRAASIVHEQVHEDANIIIGSVIDEEYADKISITIIATGFEKKIGDFEKKIGDFENKRAVESALDISNIKKNVHVYPTSRAPQESTGAYFYEQEQKLAQSVESKIMGESKFGELKQENNGGATRIDFNDLDIPTFLRKEKQDQE